MAGIEDLATIGNSTNRLLSELITTILGIFPRISGTFTTTAAATNVIVQTGVTGTSIVLLSPTNATAGTLQAGTKSLYVSLLTPGASFTVATADGTAATAGATFSYAIVNPS